MASIYKKGGSEKIWLRYQGADGKWKGKPTRYRWANMGDVRQARLLATRQSEVEAARTGPGKGERLDEWVLSWLIDKYGAMETTTPAIYKRTWRTILKFLAANKIFTAGQVTREHAGLYLKWRQSAAARNTAIGDLKLLAMVLDEAIQRGHCQANPLRRLGLKKDKAKEKEIWSDEDIRTAAAHFEREKSHWMQCVFYLGLFQACRLRQCGIPLSAIRIELGVIHWPGDRVKGGEGYSQPIDGRFVPILKKLMAGGKNGMLCVVPWDASLRLRRALDRAGLEGLSHHGLRATWITRAAEAGVAESQAMAFCHHSSREVHRVYKRLSSVGIAHVPGLISLPTFSGSSDAPSTTRDSGGGLSGRQTRAHILSERRRKASSGRSRRTAPVRKA